MLGLLKIPNWTSCLVYCPMKLVGQAAFFFNYSFIAFLLLIEMQFERERSYPNNQ